MDNLVNIVRRPRKCLLFRYNVLFYMVFKRGPPRAWVVFTKHLCIIPMSDYSTPLILGNNITTQVYTAVWGSHTHCHERTNWKPEWWEVESQAGVAELLVVPNNKLNSITNGVNSPSVHINNNNNNVHEQLILTDGCYYKYL